MFEYFFSTKKFYACRWIDSTSCQPNIEPSSQPTLHPKEISLTGNSTTLRRGCEISKTTQSHPKVSLFLSLPQHLWAMHHPILWLPQCTLTFSLMPIFILHLVELKWQMWLGKPTSGAAILYPSSGSWALGVSLSVSLALFIHVSTVEIATGLHWSWGIFGLWYYCWMTAWLTEWMTQCVCMCKCVWFWLSKSVCVCMCVTLSGCIGFVIVMDCVGSGSDAATMATLLLTDCQFCMNDKRKRSERW